MNKENKFTFSSLKYLIWIYRLSQSGCRIKNAELANVLGLKKPSVHNMLKNLSDVGMVRQNIFGLGCLTEDGYSLAQKYVFCFSVLDHKISEMLGKDATSENTICRALAGVPFDKINKLYESEHTYGVKRRKSKWLTKTCSACSEKTKNTYFIV